MHFPTLRPPLARADLHVHSCFSRESVGMGPWKVEFQAALTPLQVYERAKARGMDYVTITDHDSIDGCLDLLASHPEVEPDFIIGEEVTSYHPESGEELHVSVLGLSEEQHKEIEGVRRDLGELVSYLRSEGLVYCLNHPIWDSKGRPWSYRRLVDLLSLVRDYFPGVETRNGAALKYQNHLANRIARKLDRFVIGGSDTHTDQVGYTFTQARARTKEDFLKAVARGKGTVRGRQLTPRFARHEVRRLICDNVRRRIAVGALSARLFATLVDVFQARLSRVVARLYFRAQQGALAPRDRTAFLQLAELIR